MTSQNKFYILNFMVANMNLVKGKIHSLKGMCKVRATMDISVESHQKPNIYIQYVVWYHLYHFWEYFKDYISQYKGTCSSTFNVILFTVALYCIIL